MTPATPAAGPRIYNLFPPLCGPVSRWRGLLPRVTVMGFDWIYLNPFHYPGFSGSLYAVKDYYALNPLFADDGSAAADRPLRAFAEEAREHGLALMMDLVINHTARDGLLVEQHPEWFVHDRDGSIRSPRAIDPADARKVTVWGDLAEIDYANPEVSRRIVAYWQEVVRHYVALGFSGFRCDAAYKVPVSVWVPVIEEARRLCPSVRFFAETLGSRLEQVEALAHAGFDFLFNSVKWWDLRAPWALEQYERFRHIAPSIGFPESHDTDRLAADLPPEASEAGPARRFYLLRYALAACFATGVLMPVGYEFGFRRRLDVVHTRPGDWEEPWFDLAEDIGAINRAKMACPALNQEGPQQRLAEAGAGVALLRRTEDGESISIFAANPSPTHTISIDVARAAKPVGLPADAFANVTPERLGRARGSIFDIGPLEWQLLQTT